MALVIPLLGAVVIASAAGGEGGQDARRQPLVSLADGATLLLWSAASLALLHWWRGWRPGHLDGPAWRPNAAVGLAAAVFIIGAGVIGALASRLIWPSSLGGGGANAQSIGAGLAQSAAALAVLALKRSIFERTSGHPASSASAILGGTVGLVVVWPLLQAASLAGAGLYRLFADGTVPDIAHDSLRQIQQDPGGSRAIVIMLSAIVIAPFVEEVLYRGVVQQTLRSAGAKRGASIVATAVIFAMMHLGESAVDPSGAWSALPALFVLGLALGILYERTGRLAAPITAHALFNAVNVIMLMGRPAA